jgi:hypothetical protein
MDPRERATSVWYRIGIEGAIRSAQQEAFLEAAKLVLTGDPIEIAYQLHERAEQTIRPKG